MDDFYSVRDVPTEPLQTSSKLITTCPFFQPDDYVLFIASNLTLKAFNLTEKITEFDLPEVPTQILPILYNNVNSIVVAYSNFIIIYSANNQEIAEQARFNLQLPEINQQEAEVFKLFRNAEMTSQDAAEALEVLASEQKISLFAQKFISLPNPPENEPQHPQQSEVNLTVNRARILDGVLEFTDKITSMAIIDCSDNTLNTLTGQCVVIGTENSVFQILNSELTDPIITMLLGSYQVPISIQIEGVIGQSKSKQTNEITLNNNIQQQNTSSNQSWRATILTSTGSVISIRNNQISQNKIETDTIPRACYRLQKSIFLLVNSPFPGQIQRFSVRGRIDMQFALSNAFLELIPVNIELGKPFSGFMVVLQGNQIVFCAENGPTKVVKIDATSQVKSCYIGRFGVNDTVFVQGFDSGRIQYKLLKKTANLAMDATTQKPEKIPLIDVELLDKNDSRFVTLPISNQISIFRSFLPARAAARNAVLSEILSKNSCGIQQKTLQMDFFVSCFIEGMGPTFSLIIEVKNVGKSILTPMICSIVSSVLQSQNEALMVPSLHIGGKTQRVFVLKMAGGAQGITVPGHEIQVEVGDDGQRALWTGVVCVPEFIY